MQKTTTSLIITHELSDTLPSGDQTAMMQPSESTLHNILQFAANYRVLKISDNQFVEMILS